MNILYDGRISADCTEECAAGTCGAPRTVDGCGGCCGCRGSCEIGYAEQAEEWNIDSDPLDPDEQSLGQSIVDVHLPDFQEAIS